MTTLTPREPYSKEELEHLYPKNLKLQLVQVFLRHGERTPVSPRFQNAGLPAYWPYCSIARRMTAMVASKEDLSTWDNFQWRRTMEAFGHNDEAVIAAGPGGEAEGICQLGELTDKGRETTFALGQRLRHLYVDQLGFMPKIKSDAEDIYLRATPIPRALESLQQVFWGMYPASARTANFPPPVIVARALADETLYPNEGNCRRLRQLARLFADRAAQRWNTSEQMDYLNRLFSKWMPPSSPKVAVDGHPRLSGIMDTINASLAHGPSTRLPPVFYDEKGREIMDKIAVDEWFSGYKENVEYRKLGIGALVGDIVDRMVSTAVEGGWRSETTSGTASPGKPIKFALSGCHDTTLAAILASMGAYENEKWPPFTSSIAIELFSTADRPGAESAGEILKEFSKPADASPKQSSFLSFLMGRPSPSRAPTPTPSPSHARTPLSDLPESTRKTLRNHYVRIRYNDRPVRIPGCAAKPTNHLPGDETFCTLEAFKEIADKFTPRDWKKECQDNIDEGIFGKDDRDKVPAGY
ncbi:hypothetical protein VTN77DRAFT_7700 [Rasamsonia byssochlamydoides]|uniref:uncharacterized protein n=1 Tax=Rasamsonia byssochlamydoides TaxID=89139 RepID=UPI003743BCA8